MRIFLSLTIAFLLFFPSCSNSSQSSEKDEDAITDETQNVDETIDEIDENDSSTTDDSDDLIDESPDSDIDSGEGPSAIVFENPDPQYTQNPVAVIVTREEMSSVFEKLAIFHSLSGIPTVVTTIEKICEAAICDDEDPKNDTAKAVKDYLIDFQGLKYFVIGGDIEVVPSRQVYDSYSNIMAGTYEGDFQTDFYYADLGPWDSNGNGEYAEDDDSVDYTAEIAVGRIPVSTIDEAEIYLNKVIHHMTSYNMADVKKSLLLANVATNFSGVDINAGYYFETEGRTRDILPLDFIKRKLYAKTFPSPASDAEDLSNDLEKEALEEGVNVVVHNGHGYPTLISCEQSNDDNDFTAEMAHNLVNTTFPIFLSCACQAGQFEAPFTYTYENSSGNTVTREFTEDSAGEQYVTAPDGGGILYLGNTTTGLGLAGGSQFIDEMIRSMAMFPSSIIGESYLFAHSALKKNDTFAPPIPAVPAVPVVDEDSWRWTKKSVVMLGDPLITFWRDVFPAIEGEATAVIEEVEGGYGIRINIPSVLEGETLSIYAGEKYYSMPSVLEGENVFYIKESVSSVTISAAKEGHQLFFQKIEF